MTKEAAAGYKSWGAQKQRCYNKNHRSYKYYGAKGIKVCYSSREFVSWWLEQLESFKGEFPNTSRIDHSRDYCFENIVMESRDDNSAEVFRRYGNPMEKFKKPVFRYDLITKETVRYDSLTEAANASGVHKSMVAKACAKELKILHKRYTFRYEENVNASAKQRGVFT